MDDDNDAAEIKKQKPSDGSGDVQVNNFQDDSDNDEYGFEEYGYDLDNAKKGSADQQMQSVGGEDEDENKSNKLREGDERYEKELEDLAKLRKKRKEKKEKILEDMREKMNKKREEKRKKGQQQGDGDEKEQKEKIIAGEKVEKKKVFSHKKEEGIFRHKKLTNFSTRGIKKINKRFKKIHGVSATKKRAIVELLKEYNHSKTVLTRKRLDVFFRKFKSKRFMGPNFSRMKKEGVDLRSARKEFGKRDLDKLKRGLTGEKNPCRYQRKTLAQRGLNSKEK